MRVLIFGNSGSGKSTFAQRLAARRALALLNLDEVVWSRAEFAQFRMGEENHPRTGSLCGGPSGVGH